MTAAILPMERESELHDEIMAALSGIGDPCMAAAGLPTSIVDLGLIDGIDIDQSHVCIRIVFTEAGCPFTHKVADAIIAAVEAQVPGLTAMVVPEWREQWTEGRMTPAARAKLMATRQGRLGVRREQK
jgi:metal-sulfur cluster biosynthetic enzyme